MQHQCLDCGASFFAPGQNDAPSVQPAAQCNCGSYRTQPSGIPAEQNDMTHGSPLTAMPTSTQDDMSGNPLQEGVLNDGGWKNWNVRDESFASVRRSRLSLFETPEFETTAILAPPDLYRRGLEAEASKKYTVQLPKGITDNLHAALGNLQAWVENPSDDGQLRPYHDQYWRVIRPSFMKPGSLRIGVGDPLMAEIINHVAQTDDLTPLYQYRGKTAATKTAGPLLDALPWAAGSPGLGGLMGGGADAAAAAATDSAGSSASGVGGLMNRLMGSPAQAGQALNYVDDLMGAGGGPNGNGNAAQPQIHDMSFYASGEDDAFPNSHDEIPLNEDGDHKQQDDGNNHEWQRDISVNGTGGSDHSPSFDAGGPAMQRFMMLAPLLLQMIEGGEDGSQDPLLQGLDQALEAELPGYKDHGDDQAAEQLILLLKPKDDASEPQTGDGAASPETNEPDHTDANSGGAHQAKTASLTGDDLAEFLPSIEATPPALNGFRTAAPMPMMPPGPAMDPSMGGPMGPPPPSPLSGPPAMPATPGAGGDPTSQGPVTDEQQAWFANWLSDHGRDAEISRMLRDPALYATEFAEARQKEVPPQNVGDAQSPMPPEPAQEDAPPGATMPVPGMDAQMLSAVQRYHRGRTAADSVADKCPECGGHTTELLDADGTSRCHGCQTVFQTNGKHLDQIAKDASTWNVDEDLRKEALAGEGTADYGNPGDDPAPVQGVPIADQQHQRDVRQEQDSGHTWTDEDGNPLVVGSEYEMYSEKYDIPDLVRVEAVKPTSVVLTYVSEYGLEHDSELTKQEANIEGVSFAPAMTSGDTPGGDGSLETNDDDHTGYSGEPERTDMSAPAGLVAASVVASGVNRDNPALDWLMAGVPKTAGANYTPMEQRALIDETGLARNADLLDLSNTHYIQDADEDQFLFGI